MTLALPSSLLSVPLVIVKSLATVSVLVKGDHSLPEPSKVTLLNEDDPGLIVFVIPVPLNVTVPLLWVKVLEFNQFPPTVNVAPEAGATNVDEALLVTVPATASVDILAEAVRVEVLDPVPTTRSPFTVIVCEVAVPIV